MRFSLWKKNIFKLESTCNIYKIYINHNGIFICEILFEITISEI